MDDKADYIRVTCPNCEKRLRVPPKAAGQTITCPNCSGKVTVDAPKVAAQASDDDEFKFKDEAPAPAKLKPKPNLLDDLDLSEFDLKEVTPAKKKQDDFAKNEMDAIAAALKASESTDDEFRFACKVCGTAMYARSSEVGNMVRCPDCYAQFSIPRPTPKPQKKNVTAPKATEEVTFRSDSTKSPQENEDKSAASEYLRRAEEDLQKDVKEKKFETYDFDTLSAFDKAFGYLNDPSVWVLSIVPGLFLGGAVALAFYVFERGANSEYRQASTVGAFAVLAIFGLPMLAGCLANGLAILEAAANKVRKVSQWPFYHLGDAMGNIIMLMAVFLMSSIPGGVVGWMAVTAGLHSIVAVALPLMGIWFLFPILLLGVLDNGAMLQPYSREVVASIKERLDSWGAMYLWNSLMMAAMLLVGYFTVGKSTVLTVVGMSFVPFVMYFVFRQIGNLAAEISDVTNLHFETEDDEDEDEEDSLIKEVKR